MRRAWRGLLLGIALAATCPASAQDPAFPPLERGVTNGTFADEYYGISYTGKGIESRGRPGALFAGRLPDGTEVEIRLAESTRPMSGSEWLERAKQRWKKQGRDPQGFVESTAPIASARFSSKEEAGGSVRHGYAFHPRGHQVFTVHVRAPGAGAETDERVVRALSGFTVDPNKQDVFRLAAAAGVRARKDPRLPEVLIRAAAGYARAGPNRNRDLAEAASAAADRNAKRLAAAGKLPPETSWDLAFYGTLMYLDAGEHERAQARSEGCLGLAKRLNDPKRASACRYNLARIQAGLGRSDEAFTELSEARGANGGPMEAFVTQQAKREPDFEKLRADPRWTKLFGAPEPGKAP